MSESLDSIPFAKLAAIVIIPDRFETVARTLCALESQTVALEMQVVFVTPAQAGVTIPPDLQGAFHSVRVVQAQSVAYAAAMAEGVRAARAPIIAFTEDHAFPAPNWAERLIAAHREGYAVVGPAMRCGNPGTLVSLADFYIGYGKWAVPVFSGPQNFLMAHNASYKRDVLMEYGDALEAKLNAETALQFELAQRGEKFWLEAATQTTHLNFERPGIWIRALVYNGRSFAAQRAEQWHIAKRAMYALASPLIPAVRFRRVRRDVLRGNLPAVLRWRLYGMIAAGLCLDAVGQGMGYALGAGETAKTAMDIEFHRERHMHTPRASPAE